MKGAEIRPLVLLEQVMAVEPSILLLSVTVSVVVWFNLLCEPVIGENRFFLLFFVVMSSKKN